MTNNTPAQDRQEASSRQMLPPISSFGGGSAKEGSAQRAFSPPPNGRGSHRGSDESLKSLRPMSASSQSDASGPYSRGYSYSRPSQTGYADERVDTSRRLSPFDMDRTMQDAPAARHAENAYAEPQRAHSPMYQRYSESGPSSAYRDDRAHNEAYTRRKEERWLDERSRREQGAYGHQQQQHNPAYLPPRSPRNMDEDVHSSHRRGTFANVAEDGYHRPGMYTSSHPSNDPRSYSPPDRFAHTGLPRGSGATSGEGAGVARPSSVIGGIPSASPSTASPGSNTTANANRRVAHLLSEQKRRESINTGFEDLRQAIPTCRDGQDSKATILRRALEYIRELETIVDHSQRVKVEAAHSMGGGGFDSRSPPNDQDRLHRLNNNNNNGGGGAEDARRDPRMGRRSDEQSSGPYIGGMPGNAYSLHPSSGSVQRPMYHDPPTQSRMQVDAERANKRGIKEDPTELRRPVRRRLSEEQEQQSPDPRDSFSSSSSAAMAQQQHHHMIAQRENNTDAVPTFGMRTMHPLASMSRDDDADKATHHASRLIPC